jgi:glycosyltransferase involved in cell wall biosynthesis
MANILFHDNLFTVSGTTRALLDYAHANEKYLNNKSFLAFNKKADSSFESIWGNIQFKTALEDSFLAVEKKFPTTLCQNSENLENYIKENNIDYIYSIRSGEPGGFISSKAKNLIHAVFPQHPNNKHGDRYAFVSKWLSEHCSNGFIPFVPHIVNENKFDLNDLKINFRNRYNIPLSAKVFGRIGSFYEFNLDFVYNAIKKALDKDPNLYFIFCNTAGFYKHPRILYFTPITDLKEKYSFIAAADAMIHGRRRGETFGIAIAEYSSCNKPILTWDSPNERAHIDMLGNLGVYYNNENDLEKLFLNYKIDQNIDYNAYKKYTPEKVIKKFEEVFLK